MVDGPKFGSETVKNMLVRKFRYGLKSSGAAFRAFLAETLNEMGYWPIDDDLVLCLRPEVKPDIFEYYEYILCYVNDVLCINHNQRKLMKRIQEDFKLKDDKLEPPAVYLGAILANIRLESGKYCWIMSP